MIGQVLGHYRVLSKLGEGGMGEVYRARDTSLDRDVALKILPESFASDQSRLMRFEREAKTLASLNHPNIATIYGLEGNALVMELIDGQDLSHRILRGAMPIQEALRIARQIADALEAAHESGVIHRDLKPANIRVRADGTVKVLDFGLAKALTPTSEDTLTVSSKVTKAGVVMGTPAYMSPEQARGEVAGPQSDIWSFGAVLYEMLTGVSPFARPTSADTLVAVLGAAPEVSNLPASVRPLVLRCLERDRKRRAHHMGDVRIEIEEALSAPTGAGASGPVVAAGARTSWRRAAGVLALVGLAFAAGWLATRSAPLPAGGVVRLSIPSLGHPNLAPFGIRHLAISADGTRVAYASSGRLWIRQIDRREAVGVEVGAANPFFSPDGEWVGFFDQGGDSGLKKVPALGGTPVPLMATPDRSAGGTWRADGTVVVATSEGLYEVSADGGTPRLLVKPDSSRKERRYAWPQFISGGRSVLFTILSDESLDASQIAVLDLKTLEITTVVKGGSAAHYVSTGYLVYAAGQVLKAVAFDADVHQTRGDPVLLSELAVAIAPDNGAADFAISDTGTLVFIGPDLRDRGLRTLAWIDRHGNEEPLALAPGRFTYPRLSPDGTRVAIDIPGVNRDIWIWNLQRQSLTKLTNGPTEDLLPAWSRDSRRVFFSSDRNGNFDVYSQAADGAAPAREEFAGPGAQMTTAMTPDGLRLLLVENFKDLGVFTLARPGHVEPLRHSESNEWLGAVSPDGNWLAYESDEAGGKIEIFLRPFPNTGERREKVSIDGGRYPLWGAKGSGELFFVDFNGAMMAAAVTTAPDLRLGRVTKLFDTEKPPRGISGIPYDVSPLDGRFLMTKPAAQTGGEGIGISVVLNWFEELKRLVAAK